MQEHPGGAAEGKLAGQHLVEDDPQAVDVAPPVDLAVLAAGLLRRHVGGGAQHLAVDGDGDLAGLALGQAEVHQVGLAVLVDHDVLGLDVTMDHAVLVGIMEGVGKGGRQSAPPRPKRTGGASANPPGSRRG